MSTPSPHIASKLDALLSIRHKAPVDQLLLKDRALASASEGITIADARATDRPLIYVNEGFTRLTGYSVEETVGTNCRFLQGPETDAETVKVIRNAVSANRKCDVELLNYKKDGTPFWNHLSITPILDAAGLTTHFIGVQSDITRRRRAEDNLRAAHAKMQSNLRAAAKIQHALLPKTLPQLPGVSIGWSFLPCDELAGDILDVFQLDDSRIAFYVLDVSGHGVQAALLSTTLSRWLSGASSKLKSDPVAMLQHLNEHFQMDVDTPQFFTCCYGLLDADVGTISFSSAGHPAPLLFRSGEATNLRSPGFPVGVVSDADYTLETVKLRRNDRLYIFSDGASEQSDASGNQFGLERLTEQLGTHHAASLQASIDLALKAVVNTTADGKTDDDISMLGIEFAGRK
ncbi:MAG: hypothetical protein Aurels2KO_52800 [Aureliella sp.]